MSLLNFAVHPEERRKGVGQALLNHMIEEASSKEAESVWLDVRVSNADAIRLYRRFGFEKASTL